MPRIPKRLLPIAVVLSSIFLTFSVLQWARSGDTWDYLYLDTNTRTHVVYTGGFCLGYIGPRDAVGPWRLTYVHDCDPANYSEQRYAARGEPGIWGEWSSNRIGERTIKMPIWPIALVCAPLPLYWLSFRASRRQFKVLAAILFGCWPLGMGYIAGGFTTVLWFFLFVMVISCALLLTRDGLRVALRREEPWPWHWRERRRYLRAKAGLCLECGYDLRASPARCPECGVGREALEGIFDG